MKTHIKDNTWNFIIFTIAQDMFAKFGENLHQYKNYDTLSCSTVRIALN